MAFNDADMEAEAVAGSTVGAAGTDDPTAEHGQAGGPPGGGAIGHGKVDAPGATGPPGRDYSLESPTTRGRTDKEGGHAPGSALDQIETALRALDDISPKTSTLTATTKEALAPLTTETPLYGKKDKRDPTYYDKETIAKEEKEASTEAKRSHLHTSAAALRTAKSFLGPLGAFFGPVLSRDEIDAMTPEEVDAMVEAINAAQKGTEAKQEGLSTGEDDQKIQENRSKVKEFRETYEWTKDLSDEAVLAYVMDPNLLRLRLDNQKILDQVKATQEKPTISAGVQPQQTLWNPMSVYA